MEPPKPRVGAPLAVALLPPAVFALDALAAWHEMAWHLYRCSLDFHAGFMAALSAGAFVSGLWCAAMMGDRT